MQTSLLAMLLEEKSACPEYYPEEISAVID